MIDPIESIKNNQWELVKEYFEENDHLTVYEIAIKLNKSPSTIRNWRRKAGLSSKYPFKTRPKIKKNDIIKIDDKEIWDNEEWFRDQYEGKKHGIAIIAKIISRSPRLVVLRLNKYGIEIRSHSQAVKSNNPCSSGKWLAYHYGTRDEYIGATKDPDSDGGKSWSLKKCASEAGVVPATIYNWLVRANREGYKINIRDLNESVAGNRNPFYGKKHTEKTKERLRQTSHAYIKSRAKKSNKNTKKE